MSQPDNKRSRINREGSIRKEQKNKLVISKNKAYGTKILFLGLNWFEPSSLAPRRKQKYLLFTKTPLQFTLIQENHLETTIVVVVVTVVAAAAMIRETINLRQSVNKTNHSPHQQCADIHSLYTVVALKGVHANQFSNSRTCLWLQLNTSQRESQKE